MILSRAFHDQSGVALITVLFTVLVVTIIGLSSLNSSLIQSKVSASTREYYSAFQAAETALSIAQGSPLSFKNAIATGTPVSVSTSSASGLYPSTTLEANILYLSEGTLVLGSSIGTFKPQFFAIDGRATRTGSKGAATHRQGFRIIAPSS